jgi:hypothetical protein
MDLTALLALVRTGDELAWEAFVRMFQGRVFGLAYHYTAQAEDARDLAQDVFVRIYQNLALLLNEAVARLETPALPDGLDALSFHGTLAAGVLLILAGLMGLLSLRFGVSMAWLRTWWPAGVVLLGLYLIVRAVQDHKSRKAA